MISLSTIRMELEDTTVISFFPSFKATSILDLGTLLHLFRCRYPVSQGLAVNLVDNHWNCLVGWILTHTGAKTPCQVSASGADTANCSPNFHVFLWLSYSERPSVTRGSNTGHSPLFSSQSSSQLVESMGTVWLIKWGRSPAGRVYAFFLKGQTLPT